MLLEADPSERAVVGGVLSAKAVKALRGTLEADADALVDRLASAGDFNQAIKTFETLSYEEYSKLLGTKVPVRDAVGDPAEPDQQGGVGEPSVEDGGPRDGTHGPLVEVHRRLSAVYRGRVE